MKKTIKDEFLKKHKFKKVLLDDNSGYWWEKKIKGDIPMFVVYDDVLKYLLLQIELRNIHNKKLTPEIIMALPISEKNLIRLTKAKIKI